MVCAPSAFQLKNPSNLTCQSDMLDEFSPSKPEPQPPVKAPSIPSGPGRPESTFEGISDDDFAKQLQAGMADLLGELETSPDMQAQFENMLKELGGATGAAAVAEPGVSLGHSPASSIKGKEISGSNV